MVVNTVIKRVAAESIRLKIEMAKISMYLWSSMAKSQTSKSLSLENVAVEIVLEKSIGEKV